MPSDDSSVGDALSHQSLKVSRDDPQPCSAYWPDACLGTPPRLTF